jgi:glycosyltransferase involved in cell wall biosynthesis
MLSIITITYQAEAYIERTLKSLAEQGNRESIEYIVIDGASKDGTLNLLKHSPIKIDHFISEKDQGIYDAMNKGLRIANGDYVLFMNAGDTFFDAQSVTHLLKELETQPDVVYGDAQFVNLDSKPIGLRSEVTPHRLPKQASWKDFKFGMVICHQAFVVKRILAPAFSLDYSLSSDIDWEISCLKHASIVKKSERPICNYLMGGASVQQLKKSWIERFQVLSRHFGFFPSLIFHIGIIGRGIRFAIKKGDKYW